MNVSSTETPGQYKPKRSPAVPAVIAIAAILVVGLFLRSRSAKQGDAPKGDKAGGPQIRTVKTIPITKGTLVQRLAITGALKANQTIDLNPKISGHVDNVYVSEGQHVKRGQLLVSLDEADLRQQIDAAKAALQTQQVKLDQTRLNLPSRISELQSAVDQARAQLANSRAAAQAAQARYKQALLQEPAAITTTRSQLASAQAGVRSAEAQLKSAQDTAKQTKLQVTAAVNEARAALAQANAQLAQTKAGSRVQEIAQAQSQVNVVQAQLNDAQTSLTRQQQLFAGGATAKASVDSAQTQYEVVKAQLESAQQNLSLVREGSRTQEVQAAEEVVRQRQAALQTAQANTANVLTAQSQVTQAFASLAQAQQSARQSLANQANIPVTRQETRAAQEAVNQAQSQVRLQEAALRQAQSNLSQVPGIKADVPAAQAAVRSAQVQLDQANLNLGYARIVSPINGVVNTKNTDVGESAAPGTPLFNLVSLDNVYFEAQVPESQLAQIKIGQPAQITVNAISDKPVIGYVTDIIRVASTTLRQFRLRITLPNSGVLTPGAFARGQLQTQVISGALSIPDEDVRTEGDQNYVLVVAGSGDATTVKRKDIKIGISANGQTQILGGVSPDDKIITGNTSFQDGNKIKVAKDKDL